jgi:hypothetical protein
MPSHADPLSSRKIVSRRWADSFTVWNRKLHYYVGLYLLFFVWLFAFSGLLLNHSSWAFAQFFPNRKVSNLDRPIQPPTISGDLEQAKALMRQLGIEGEIAWNAPRSDPAYLDFNASRPGRIYEIHADLQQGRAKITVTEFNPWGIMRTLHTFVGVSPEDPSNRRDWVVTTVWALSMDAVAGGLVFMVLSSFYMWWGLQAKRKPGLVALALGIALCGLFVFGLRWLYG